MRSRDCEVSKMLDFTGIEGFRCLLEEPRKVSQNRLSLEILKL